MSKNNGHINYEELIGRYLANETDQQEINLLEKWVQESSANRKLFIQHKRAWQLTQSPDSYSDQFDTDRAWAQMETELFSNKKTIVENKTIKFRPIYRMAAAIAALITIGYFVFYLVYINVDQTLVASNKILTETLADGTEVTLNRNSILSFPKQFEENTRRVELEGAAFFNVARNPDKPFIIESGEVSVEVLGTSFYVNAKSGEAVIEVTVKTGKVALRSGEENMIELVTGDKGTFNKQNKTLSKASNTDSNFLAWKTKKLLFKNTPLEEVFRKIQETYHVNIQVLNTDILSCTWTASFDNQPLETVLNILKETFDLEIKQSGENIILSGPSCN